MRTREPTWTRFIGFRGERAVGPRGSALELVLVSLHFGSQPPEAVAWREVVRVREAALAEAVPLHLVFATRGHPTRGVVSVRARC